MQVKKFEAPTLQEALERVKRELGPEAIILQTKKNKKGFGIMSRSSVEITAAVSERSLQKKQLVETRVPEPNQGAIQKLPADKQADFFDQFMDKHLSKAAQTQDKVDVGQKRITATRYIDIEDDQGKSAGYSRSGPAQKTQKNSQPQTIAQSSSHASEQGSRQLSGQASRQTSGQTSAPASVYTQAQLRGQSSAQSTDSRGQSHGTLSSQLENQSLADSISDTNLAISNSSRLPATQTGMSLEDEVKHLKQMIQELKSSQETEIESQSEARHTARFQQTALEKPLYQDAFEQLIINGIDRRYALSLIKKVAFELGSEFQAEDGADQLLDLLAVEVMDSIDVLSPLSRVQKDQENLNNPHKSPTLIALIGPTGVGKTTTVAKLASEAMLKRGLKVGLINLDNYKLTAFDQLGTYAKILNVPFRSVSSIEDLKASLLDFNSLDVVFVDTTGRSQRDPESLKEMQTILHSIPELSTYIVLSATTRDAELYDAASRFAVFRPQGMIISKLDEATVYGGIYNVAQKVKVPLLYFTTGQKIPEDIEEATKERVAALVLDI